MEDKLIFFHQYYGQDIATNDELLWVGVTTYVNHISANEKNYLLLKPTTSISEEEAFEISKIIYGEPSEHEIVQVYQVSTVLDFMAELDKIYSLGFYKASQIVDYLRSKGYALPFNGISVKEQINRGWVKLKAEQYDK